VQTVVETPTYLAIANKTSDLQPFFGHAVKISADHRHIGFGQANKRQNFFCGSADQGHVFAAR